MCHSQKLTEEEQKLFRLYGKLPTHKNVLTKMQKVLLCRTVVTLTEDDPVLLGPEIFRFGRLRPLEGWQGPPNCRWNHHPQPRKVRVHFPWPLHY